MKKIRGGITAPLGFKAAALNCGIKRKKLDIALVASELPAVAAGVFTTNVFKAAPVVLCQKDINSKTHKAVIINSGNANCLTGKKGLDDCIKITKQVAGLIGSKRGEVLICSTGIIGRRLPIKKITAALPSLAVWLSKASAGRCAEAIMTTDTFKKEAVFSIKAGSKEIRIAGIAKGAGMIEPNMATMLSLITTDAKVSKQKLKQALKEAVEPSFNSITVDGDMSTNDTVLILANGASGVNVAGSKVLYEKFLSGLKAVCLELAKMIVKDGEGATKFIEIEVKGAKTQKQAKAIALAVANSSLFKTMCYGENPNFGRIAAACGAYQGGIIPGKVDIYLNGIKAVGSGVALKDKLPKNTLKAKNIKVALNLNIGTACAKVYASDLSPKYVKINAEYS
ncbi:MAG: bifunctional glutamate N-acetyltransferase/amino-acid acetyltransferase ArgJ [Candidatus Omnitrophica bacterium]|nr:bifunctional glutamate N-acetyltransferase/amino-acid acetyltransferase ArgJ [Candidatus Omnitrophota bacterium]